MTPLPPVYYSHDPQRQACFDQGRKDRLYNFPCRETNGAYLDGWYYYDNLSNSAPWTSTEGAEPIQ